MPRYVIIHGSVHKGGHQATGSVVELTVAEAKEIDPTGTCLMLESKHLAAKAGEKASAEAIKRVEEEQAAAEAKAAESKPDGAEKSKHHTKK